MLKKLSLCVVTALSAGTARAQETSNCPTPYGYDPSTQHTICSRTELKAWERETARAEPASPPSSGLKLAPPNLSKRSHAFLAYRAKMLPLYKIQGEASAIEVCDIRSNFWYDSIMDGIIASLSADPTDRAITSQDRKDISREGSAISTNIYHLITKACHLYLNSVLVKNLDNIQSQMIGDYQ